jgi:hypothetical protein
MLSGAARRLDRRLSQWGAELFRRLRSAGYAGSSRVVAEWAARRRRTEAAPTQAPIAPPSARSIARLMTIARDQVSGTDAVTVTVIEQALPQLVNGRDLLDRFQQMIRSKAGYALDTWIRGATAVCWRPSQEGSWPTNKPLPPQSSSPGPTGKPKAKSPNSR